MNAANIIKQIIPKREAFVDSINLTTSLFIIIVIALFSYLLYLTITAPSIPAVRVPNEADRSSSRSGT